MFGVKAADALVEPDDENADQRVFALKPMNCPGHVQIFKHGLKSYRDLPMRLAEFGAVHRYEPSGALHGLLRVRAFTQDDAHVFCTEDQLESEILKINDLMMSVYEDFGFEEVEVKLPPGRKNGLGPTRPGITPSRHSQARLGAYGGEDPRIKIGINEGEGTFYGPKFEYTLKDAIGRDWQLRHHAGGLQSARTVRRVLRRQGWREGAAGDGAPGDLWIAGTVSGDLD
jgi:threonyl-tRNA synthetase